MARRQLGPLPSRPDDAALLSLLYGITVTGLETGSGAATTNGTKIRAAIDSAAAAGGGAVIIPSGRWFTTPLRVKSKVRLMGTGRWSSELVLANGANAHMIVLDTNQVFGWCVEGLLLNGNKTQQTGNWDVIYFDSTGYSGPDATTFLDDDTHGLLRDVAVRDASGNGVHLMGVRGSNQLFSLVVQDSQLHGFLIESPDNLFYQCIAGNNGSNGFRFQGNGSASRGVNCKAFLSGRVTGSSAGFHFEFTSYSNMVGIEAQDNRGHGIACIGEIGAIIIGKTERNGLGPEPVTGNQGDGLYMQGTKDSIITLTSGDRGSSDGTNPGALLQGRPWNLGPGNDRNQISIVVGANKSPGVGSWGPNSIVTVTGQAPGGAAMSAVSTGSTVSGNFQPGSYTLTTDDAGGRVVEMGSSSSNTLTIPTNTDAPIPIGTIIEVCQYGAGQTTFAPASGVALRAPDGLRMAMQYGTATLRKRAADEWVLAGAVTV